MFDPILANKTFSCVLYAFEDLGKEIVRTPYQTVNPCNGKVLRTFDQHTDQQMERMLAAADKTFREIWSKKPVRDRAKIIGKAASLMLEQKEKFARLATLEMEKRISASRGAV